MKAVPLPLDNQATEKKISPWHGVATASISLLTNFGWPTVSSWIAVAAFLFLFRFTSSSAKGSPQIKSVIRVCFSVGTVIFIVLAASSTYAKRQADIAQKIGEDMQNVAAKYRQSRERVLADIAHKTLAGVDELKTNTALIPKLAAGIDRIEARTMNQERNISAEQRQRFLATASKNPKGVVEIVGMNNNNESIRYSRIIGDLLAAAGFEVRLLRNENLSPAPEGIFLTVLDVNKAPLRAGSLAKALSDARIPFFVESDPIHEVDRVLIRVGTMPITP